MKKPLKYLRTVFAPVAVVAMTALPGMLKSQSLASADHSAANIEAPTARSAERAENTASITRETKDNNTDPKDNSPIVLYDDKDNALDVSRYRDGKWEKDKARDPHYVGVYLVIDQDCAMSNEQLIPWLQKYFDHYDLPVKFVRQTNPSPGKLASAVFYVNGESYDGDLSTGNLSFVEIKQNHKQVFAELQEMYEVANKPGMSMTVEPR